MPQYQVSTPDGSTYQIDAPNDQAAHEAVGHIFSGKSAAPDAASQQEAPVNNSGPKNAIDSAKLTAQELMQGGTFGWADELTGLAGTPMAYAASKFTDAPMSMAQSYDASMAAGHDAYSLSSDYNKEHPIAGAVMQAPGALISGSALAKLAAASAPAAASRIATYAAENPLKAAAALGTLSGSIYGSGSAEPGNRTEGAITGGGAGAVAGSAFLLGGRVASPGIEALYRGATRLLGGEAAAPAAEASAASSRSTASAAPESALSELSARKDGALPLTSGQRTQNAETQKLEQAALEGDFGPGPRIQMREVRTTQNQAVRDLVSKMGDASDPRQVNDIVSNIGEVVSNQAGAAKRAVNSAYSLAREGAGVKIGRDDLRDGLLSSIAEARRAGGYDITKMPNARGILDSLRTYAGDMSKGSSRVTSVRLGRMEQLRTQATQASQRSTDPTEQRFLREIVSNYDNFMSETAAGAAVEGDAAAINSFKNAVGERARYGRIFERNNLVKSIVEGRGADDLTRDLFGSGVVSGRAEMSKNLQSIFTAAGQEAPAVKSDMQTAVMKRLFERSARGFQEGTDAATPQEFLSPASLAKNLGQLVANPEFTKNLYGPQALPALRVAIKDLQLMGARQPATINNSGTAFRIVDIMKNSGLIGRIPVVGQISGILQKGSEQLQAGRSAQTVAKGLSEFISSAPELAAKSNFLTRNIGRAAGMSGIAGGAAGGQP